MRIVPLFLILFMSFNLFATGPSNMKIQIDPISINENRDVLCKSYHYYNSEGALMQMPIFYQWVVITSECKIYDFLWHNIDTLSDTDWTSIEEELNYWQKVYQEEIDFNSPPKSLIGILDQYDFKANNVEKYKIMEETSISDFLQKFISYKEISQITIRNHYSVTDFEDIFVKYAFPNFVLVNNSRTLKMQNGADFDFYYSYSSIQNNLDYELFKIDAIIPRRL